jgi:hypothetical protein
VALAESHYVRWLLWRKIKEKIEKEMKEAV